MDVWMDTALKSYSWPQIVAQGTVVLPVTCKSKTYNIKLYVVDVKASPVLSAETWWDFKKKIPDADEQLAKPINLKEDYPELCINLPRIT